MNGPSLQQLRLQYQPKLPISLQHLEKLEAEIMAVDASIDPEIAKAFPLTKDLAPIKFLPSKKQFQVPLKVGVVFSGGQAAGGHNVIAGLFKALRRFHKDSVLIGFRDGPKGIINNQHIVITDELVAAYMNQGGFDMIGSGRTKIETPEQFQSAKKTAQNLGLDGLVIIGGDDSNTNAAYLAEYFLKENCSTSVVGVPKTIDGDLKNNWIEASFGFDSACKTYSEIIGNILRDIISARKYYFFVKIMGRAASHVALECALQTRPNMTLISEEIESRQQKLSDIVKSICDMICARALQGKDYGMILIPEGVIEFIPDFKALMKELNSLFAANEGNEQALQIEAIRKQLQPASLACFDALPAVIQNQLLLDRDPHGNLQVSKIETERLFIDLVEKELKKRRDEGKYSGTFNAQPLFCGYEGRSCLPSNFDAQYCYALGHAAALLLRSKATGYMAIIRRLCENVEAWEIQGIPLITMMGIEERKGKQKAVIKKALLHEESQPFQLLQELKNSWILEDNYCYPGPIQFYGPAELTERVTITLATEAKSLAHLN
jgi:pyrophosphate--fructose-6-phosphate 1-phosphotransferase